MALLDAYCSLDDYRDRIQDKGTGADAVVSAQLVAGSRLCDRSMRLAPGGFNSATGTRRFSGNGEKVLWLKDDTGHHFLQSVDEDGIAIDDDADGTAEYLIDPTNEAWVVGLPRNAAVFSEPYDRLQLLGLTSNTTLSTWPEGEYNIAITGTWGWATVPDAIVDFVAHLVHDIQVGLVAGATLEMPTIDAGGLSVNTNSWRLWRQIKQQYGFGGLGRVA